MKKMIALLIGFALMLSLASGVAENSLEAIKAAGKIVVATSPDYPPYEFPGPDGEYVGADIVLAEYLADKLGVELVIDAYDFDGVLAAIIAGKVDLAIAGIDPTPERAESMAFSDVYYNESNQTLVVHKDNAEALSTLAAFEGKKVAAQNGSVQETMVKEYLPGAQLEQIAKIPDGVMLLLSKNVDGMAMASVVADQYVVNYPDLVIAEEKFPYTSLGIAIALTKDEPELLEAINAIIKEVVDSGDYYTWMEEAVELNSSMTQGE